MLGGLLREKYHLLYALEFVPLLGHCIFVPENLWCIGCLNPTMLCRANLINIGGVGLSDFNKQQ